MRICQFILAFVFAVTAGLKIAAAAGHSPAMAQTMFGILPPSLQWALIATELLLALWIVSNWKPRLSAFAAISLLSIFLAAVIIEITKQNPLNCGCFGAASSAVKPLAGLIFTIVMDTILLALAIFVYFKTLSPSFESHPYKNAPQHD